MARQKQEKRKKARVLISAQCNIGTDDDLIGWALEVRRRGIPLQVAIKEVLRYGLGLPQPEPERDRIEALDDMLGNAVEYTRQLETQLHDTRQQVNQLNNLLDKALRDNDELRDNIAKFPHAINALVKAQVRQVEQSIPAMLDELRGTVQGDTVSPNIQAQIDTVARHVDEQINAMWQYIERIVAQGGMSGYTAVEEEEVLDDQTADEIERQMRELNRW